ncbi:UDP-N-acetylmuramoyl-L-alanine--D-glutamate ligase [Saprospiraceae bacterium]|nr:UDP-N-acetylmuramoyl-L-alanine--D-glutamate ligase [Saprospiraceae bacterium]
MKTVSVLGGGESGVGAALLAQQKGYKVFVSDFGSIPEKYKSELLECKIPFEERGHSFEKIVDSDIIIKSPGIPVESKLIKKLIAQGKKHISEIEFASKFYNGQVISVTGSNGKSTTVSLIYHLLHIAGLNVGLGGNIGYAFSRLLIEEKDYDYIVLELSSFQLDDVYDFLSDIAVLLNISADHLDRYDYDINKYAAAKWRLVERVRTGGTAILNKEDVLTQGLLERNPVTENVIQISSEDPIESLSKDNGDLFEINLLGKHNLFNAAVAKEVTRLLNIPEEVIQKGLLGFSALEHRLEKVAVIDGVTYINDSKATNVDSVKYALSAVDALKIWIAGGTDKGNDYTELVELVKGNVKVLICLGVDCEKLKTSFNNVVPEILETQSMSEAVQMAHQKAEDNEVVLLSPACASFDLFDNYIHRGNEFKKEVFKIESGIL